MVHLADLDEERRYMVRCNGKYIVWETTGEDSPLFKILNDDQVFVRVTFNLDENNVDMLDNKLSPEMREELTHIQRRIWKKILKREQEYIVYQITPAQSYLEIEHGRCHLGYKKGTEINDRLFS